MGLSDVWRRNKDVISNSLNEQELPGQPPELIFGNMIGSHYILESVIHEGGMGKIYLAHHNKKNIRVAVKTIRVDNTGDNAKQLYNRFRREAKGLALLTHPNIVRILGCDLHDPKQAYIVMEYVDGQTLWKFMGQHREGVLIHVFLQIMVQLCSAFDLLHKKGIVHRDLKPNNVMISGDVRQYSIKILDLGLIFFEKALTNTAALKLTRKGQLVGTPAYMSPEQCRGDEVTHLSDIYNLGLIAYELLSGRPVNHGKNPADMFVKQLKVKPKPLHSLRPEVPLKISEAIQCALEKDPKMRPQSSREFFDAMHF